MGGAGPDLGLPRPSGGGGGSKGELRGSRGRGVVGNNWFDRVLLPMIHMSEPWC